MSRALLAVAGYCGGPERLSRALASIQDPGRRCTARPGRALEPHPATRGAIRIGSRRAQTALVKQLRGKDKSVYKIIREKCDALNAEEQRIAKTRSDAVAAYESLERHSHRVYDVIYEPTFRHFQTRWQALAAAGSPGGSRARLPGHRALPGNHRRAPASARAASRPRRPSRPRGKPPASRRCVSPSSSRSALREAAARAAAEAAALREAEDKARAEKSAAEALALREISALIGKAQGALREGGHGTGLGPAPRPRGKARRAAARAAAPRTPGTEARCHLE